MKTVREQELELASLLQDIAALQSELHRPPHTCRSIDKGLIVASFLCACGGALVWAFVGTFAGGATLYFLTGLFNCMLMALGFGSMFQPGYLATFPMATLMFRIGAVAGCLLGALFGFVCGSDVPHRHHDGSLRFHRIQKE